MADREPRLFQQLLRLRQAQLQRHDKGEDRRLARPVFRIGADLREQPPVHIGLPVALRVLHALLVDQPQQRPGKALVRPPDQLLPFQPGHQASGDAFSRRSGFRGRRRPHFRLRARRALREDSLFQCQRLLLILQPGQLPRVFARPVDMAVDIVVADVFFDILEQLPAGKELLPAEHDQIDRHLVAQQELADRVHRDLHRLLLRITVGPRGNQGKGNGFQMMLSRQLQRAAVAGGKQLPLPGVPAPPDRAHRMDDIPGGQPIALRQLRLPRFTAAQLFAFGPQLRAGGAVNGAVHPAASEQRPVGGVDNGIHLHPGDVVPHNFKGHACSLPFLRSVFPGGLSAGFSQVPHGRPRTGFPRPPGRQLLTTDL